MTKSNIKEREMFLYRYIAEFYGGRLYCGNGFFDNLDDVLQKAIDEYFIDRIVINDTLNNKIITLKIKEG